MEKNIWTIGHSNMLFDKFLSVLQSFDIQIVADIRSLPGSGKNPQFNKESLITSLTQNNVEYIHLKNLGGLRKTRPDSKNTAWQNSSFRGYADYMETEEFYNAVEELKEIAINKRTAIMCAESLWWRCHRSLVSDYLKLNRWCVVHIMGNSKGTSHSYTKPSRISEGKLIYDNIQK